MSNVCTSCGNKISMFLGNKPEFGTIERAKYINVYREGLCQACLSKLIEKHDHESQKKQEVVSAHALQVLDKVKVSAEAKPNSIADLGLVSGYSVIGTGPISGIFSSFTDFFGVQSMIYIKKIKEAEEYALKILKMSAIARGGNSVFSCKIQVTEASTGHGMIMFSANGTAVNIPSVFSDEENKYIQDIIDFYKERLGGVQ